MDQLREALAAVARDLGAADADVQLERPREEAHGDLATNLALQLAKRLKRKPRDVAAEILAKLTLPPGVIEKAEIAGPGFVNFFLAERALGATLTAVLGAGERYGRSDVGAGRRANVEFVSANPTGPLHVGHGRQAALGDAIASLLEATGWQVTREYYYNDAGAQIANLTHSVQAWIRRLGGEDAAIPPGGYHGEYVRDIAEQYVHEHPSDAGGADLDAIRQFAVRALREEQDRDLQAFGVAFDVYALESALYAGSQVDTTVRRLVSAGHAYERDGALWLRTTDFGDDKDRVMRKSAEKGGDFTYFVPDVAYHVSKWERGFTRAINVQGADHHGTVARVRAGLQALEMAIPEGYPEYVLHQMVSVTKGGEEVKLSKRAGSYLTLRELVDDVGRDAVRYFFLMRRGDSQLVFDVDLAKKQSEENPVYYVQYAHTRMAGIFRNADRDPTAVGPDFADPSPLSAPAETELLKLLGQYPAVVEKAAEFLEPHRVIAYLEELARAANAWYHHHRVLGEPAPIERARLMLARAVQIVLRNGLTLVGVSAPERM